MTQEWKPNPGEKVIHKNTGKFCRVQRPCLLKSNGEWIPAVAYSVIAADNMENIFVKEYDEFCRTFQQIKQVGV